MKEEHEKKIQQAKEATAVKKETKDIDWLTEDDMLFDSNEKGELIPQTFEISVYDQHIDMELLQETFILGGSLNKKESIQEIKERRLKGLKEKIESSEGSRKETLEDKYENLKTDFDTRLEFIEKEIQESRDIIKELQDEKKAGEKKKVKLIPLRDGELNTVKRENKPLAGYEDLSVEESVVAHCLKKPEVTKEQVKNMKGDFRAAICRKVDEISGWKSKTHKELLIESRMSEKK